MLIFKILIICWILYLYSFSKWQFALNIKGFYTIHPYNYTSHLVITTGTHCKKYNLKNKWLISAKRGFFISWNICNLEEAWMSFLCFDTWHKKLTCRIAAGGGDNVLNRTEEVKHLWQSVIPTYLSA